MNKTATSANTQIMTMLNNTNLKKLTGTHHETETIKLATEFSSHLPTILIKQKQDQLPYLLKPSRTAAMTKDLHELLVRNINLSNKWLQAIQDTFPTATATESNFTISNKTGSICSGFPYRQ